jgi:hypothetical protein
LLAEIKRLSTGFASQRSDLNLTPHRPPLRPPLSGCSYSPPVITSAGAVATVTPYDYSLTAPATASAFGCIGSRASATINVTLSVTLAGADVTAVAQPAGPTCTRTNAPGVVFQCTNMDRNTTVVFTAAKTGGGGGR